MRAGRRVQPPGRGARSGKRPRRSRPHGFDVRTNTLVSRSKKRLKALLRAVDGPGGGELLSPRGSENVFYLRRRRVSNLNQIITAVTKDGYPSRRNTCPRSSRAKSGSCCSTPSRSATASALRSTAAARWSARTAARPRKPRHAQPVRARPHRRPHLRHPAPQAAHRRRVLRRRRHRRRQDPRAQRLHPRRHPLIHELCGIDVGDVVIRDLERRVHLRTAYRTTV